MSEKVNMVRVNLTKSEKEAAKKIARKEGYTFCGYLSHLVRSEIKKHQESV